MEVIDKLSTNLKNELFLQSNINVLNSVSFLKNKFSLGYFSLKVLIY